MKKISKNALQADIRFPTAIEAAPIMRELVTRDEFAGEIRRLWDRAQDQFIAIGRYLEQAKEKLPYGEFEEMVERDLPFSSSVARRLRTATAMIDSGEVSAEALPSSYSVVYELASMTPEERGRAAEAGLVRPDVTRKELVTFKRSLRNPAEDPNRSVEANEENERLQIEARIIELQREQSRIGREIRSLQKELARLGGGRLR